LIEVSLYDKTERDFTKRGVLMKKIMSKWWILLLIVLFILINLFVNNLNEAEKEEQPRNGGMIQGNIDTH